MANMFIAANMIGLCFLTLTIISMTVTHVAQIRGRIAYLVVENSNLLDKMHEGLIVVSSQADLSLKFSSLPAVRLLK